MKEEKLCSPVEHQRRESIEWLVTIACTAAMGGAAAFMFSIESVNPTVRFGLSWKVWVSFLVVSWLTLWGCRTLFFSSAETESASNARRRRWFYGLTVLGLVGPIAGMAYSLRGISHEKLMDVGFGVLLAAFFLSIAFYLFMTVVRFLESDEKRYSDSVEGVE